MSELASKAEMWPCMGITFLTGSDGIGASAELLHY
jgi:hypothetical protein